MITILVNASDLIKHTGATNSSSENTKQTWIKCQEQPGTSQQLNVHTSTKQLLGNTHQDAKPFHIKDDLVLEVYMI